MIIRTMTRNARTLGLAALMVTAVATTSPAHAEKVFRYTNFGDLETLDPQLDTTIQEDFVLGNFFVTLLTEAADGTLIPGAAESWTISPDGLTYTFKLRPHLWSDGQPVTADDFVFTYRRFLDPATAAPNSALLFVIKNAEAYNQGKAKVEDVGVKALDSQMLEITLESPTPYLLGLLAHYNMSPLPKHVVEKLGKDWAKPATYVGNGPFVLESYSANDKTVLVKNPKFYDAANVRLDKAVIYALEDLTEHQKRFRAGDVEATDRIPPDQQEWATKNMPEETKVMPYLGLHYYQFNVTKPPFNDVRVRQALAMVIDRNAMSNKVMKTGEIPAYSYVPPDIEGYGKPVEVEWKEWPMDKRIAEAKKLMAEAGYGPNKPLKFTLSYNTNDEHKKRAIAIVAMWKQTLGVQADLFNTEGKVHFANLRVRDFQAARYGWIGDYPDPQSFLQLAETRAGTMNHSGYSNADYDALMLEASKTQDVAKRSDLMHRAEAIVLRDLPDVPLAYYVSTHMVSKKVKGWEYNILDHHRLRWIDIVSE